MSRPGRACTHIQIKVSENVFSICCTARYDIAAVQILVVPLFSTQFTVVKNHLRSISHQASVISYLGRHKTSGKVRGETNYNKDKTLYIKDSATHSSSQRACASTRETPSSIRLGWHSTIKDYTWCWPLLQIPKPFFRHLPSS